MSKPTNLASSTQPIRSGPLVAPRFAAEEARLLDELLASADLSSPTTPKVRSSDQTRDAETAHGQATDQTAPASAPEQPQEQPVTVPPSTCSSTDDCEPHVHGYDDDVW